MRKNIKTLSIAIALSAFLTGCETMMVQNHLETSTTTFSTPSFQAKGTLAIIAADASKNNSLEFAHFRKYIAKSLQASGYTITEDLTSAEQFAIVSYGIDNGRSEVRTIPIWGQTGGGSTYSSGTINTNKGFGSYSGSTYTMPQFGVVGSSTNSTTVYKRVLAIDIVEGSSFRANNPEKLIEIRTESTGSCGVIASVLPLLIDASLDGFPAPSGSTRKGKHPTPQSFC